MYLLEESLKDGSKEKKIFLNKFKPTFYWNMINGLFFLIGMIMKQRKRQLD